MPLSATVIQLFSGTFIGFKFRDLIILQLSLISYLLLDGLRYEILSKQRERDVSITCFVRYQSTPTSSTVLILKEKLEGLRWSQIKTNNIFWNICRQCNAIIQLCLADISKIYYYCRTSRYSIFHSYRFSFIFDLYIQPNIKAFILLIPICFTNIGPGPRLLCR